jgi:hypothetical protein
VSDRARSSKPKKRKGAARGKAAAEGAPGSRDLERNRSQSTRRSRKTKPGGKPFPKGVSGNPDTQFGRPNGNPINTAGRPPMPAEYKLAMERMEPDAFRALEEIIADPFHRGRREAAEYVINRMRGRPRQTLEITGASGGPLEFEDVTSMTTGDRTRDLQALLEKALPGGAAAADAAEEEAEPEGSAPPDAPGEP